jgi:uncharacterized protein (UPF0332 family)
MPIPEKHYQKALYNEKFFHDIKQNYTDWAITGIFYSALHLVDAFLARKKLYPKDHKERTNYVGKIPMSNYLNDSIKQHQNSLKKCGE